MRCILVLLAFFCISERTGLAKTTTLSDDLEDFVDLIPVDDIKDIWNKHLENDPAIAAVVYYMQQPLWGAILEASLIQPAAQEFVKYLTDSGVDVLTFLDWFETTINNIELTVDPDKGSSLRPFLDEVESILPVDKLVDLLFDKLQNSVDFQELYLKESSQKMYEWLEFIRSLDEIVILTQDLRDMGVKVDETFATIYSFFGWKIKNKI